MRDKEYRISYINKAVHFDNAIGKDAYVLFINGAEIFNSRGSLLDVENREFLLILEYIASFNKLEISEGGTYE